MSKTASWQHFSRPAWQSQLGLLLLCVLFFCWGLLLSFGLAPGQVQTYGQQLAAFSTAAFMAIAWGPFALALFTLLYRHYLWRYTIEDGSITSTRGIVGRHSRSINVDDVRNVNVNQTFLQRVLGIGDVEFSSAGGSGIEVAFEGVRSPALIAEAIQEERHRLNTVTSNDE